MPDIEFDRDNVCYACGAVVWNKNLHLGWHHQTQSAIGRNESNIDQIMRGPDAR